MKQIYIVISQTGTLLSMILKLVTGKEYNHASFSLDYDLCDMFSFGRKDPYNPFVGVFLIEHINEGTYKRFKNTKCKVISVDVTDEQYELICEKLIEMVSNMEKYKYNLLGLFLAGLDIEFSSSNRFYCSEFVKYLLDVSNVDISMIPNIPHPVDFLDVNDSKIIYEGCLNDYPKRKVKKL